MRRSGISPNVNNSTCVMSIVTRKMSANLSVILLVLTSLQSVCFCFEFVSGIATAVGVGALSASYASYNYFKCRNTECCNNDWINFNESMLAESMRKNMFGQHLAEALIRKSLHGYLKNQNPRKALVMAFNGLTGSGKNYATSLIANSTYKKGMKSDFVHIYVGTKDFPHKNEVSKYQDELRRNISQYTKECDRSLFIFDEVDKMPPGTLDALKPYIDYYEQLDGVDYKKNIFIFLSNAGSSDIVALTLKFWADGLDRESIVLKDIEPLINKGAFNENGGFQFSELLRSELIDIFVPFLPLEKKHVKKCIEVEMKSRGKDPTKTIVNRIADELVYFPPEVEIFSKSGCKRIMQKVDLFVD